jgi:raffinose/stachyose/melibiose transport system permease protein
LNKVLKFLSGSIVNVLVMMFSVTCVFPLVWILYSSLKTQAEFSLNIISLPKEPQFTNYINAIKIGGLHKYFFNSVFNSVVSVALIIIIAFMVSYFLSRYRFKGRNFIYVFFLAGMLVPIHGLLVPVYIEFNTLSMIDKRLTLILPYVAFGLPTAIFLMESFIKTIPVEVEEAAVIDGCSLTQRIFSVVMPMCKPVISTTVILSFLNTWNEFPFALVLLKSKTYQTIPVGLTNFSGEYTTNYTQLMAAMVIAILPVVITYLLFYKKIMQGMTAGAVKG